MSNTRSSVEVTEQLCLGCGLCCNGVLFRDVELQPGDAPQRLRTLGMPLTPLRKQAAARLRKAGVVSAPSGLKFNQPCSALRPDCRCRIYPDRPARCRDFECALFKAVAAGTTASVAAKRIIRSTLQQAERVKSLLRQLGDTEETLALSLRFQRIQKQMHRDGPDEAAAEVYSELTLAVHDLNMSLRREFYPDPGDV
jgi:uncharacterized protein